MKKTWTFGVAALTVSAAVVLWFAMPEQFQDSTGSSESRAKEMLLQIGEALEALRERDSQYGSPADLARYGLLDDRVACAFEDYGEVLLVTVSDVNAGIDTSETCSHFVASIDGYSFNLIVGNSRWQCSAKPEEPGTTGRYVFYLDYGHVFRRKSIWRRWNYALPITIGAAILILLFSLLLSYRSARRHGTGNEASAISALRTLSSAQELFNARYGRYAPTLAALGNAGMIDQILAGATTPAMAKSGYFFQLRLTQTGWECSTMPATPGVTGTRSFYINEDGVIYWRECMDEYDPQPAQETGTPLGG
jgi:hypothetical protein